METELFHWRGGDIPLYRYQAEAAEKMLEAGFRGMLALEPGMGKTRTALAIGEYLLENAGLRNMAVVCPLNAIGVWYEEGKQWGQSWTPLSGSTREKKAYLLKTEQGGWDYLLNYETLAYRDGRHWPIVDELAKRIDLLIVDESHYVKNPSTVRSKALARLASRVSFVLLLTGTPVDKNLLDLYHPFKVLDPWIWNEVGEAKAPSFTKWKQRVAYWGGYENRILISYRNPDKILNRIAPRVYAKTKKAAGLQMPETTDQIIPWQVPVPAYRKAKAQVEVEPYPITRALRWQQELGRLKLPTTLETITQILEAGLPVLVFYRFTEEGQWLKEKLEHTFDLGVIDGEASSDHRTNVVAASRFWTDNNVPHALLVQIQAGSVALNLQHIHEVVFHSLTWSHAEHKQARDRVHRIGQSQNVTYRYVVARGPVGGKLVDDLILTALQNKSDVAKTLMQEV